MKYWRFLKLYVQLGVGITNTFRMYPRENNWTEIKCGACKWENEVTCLFSNLLSISRNFFPHATYTETKKNELQSHTWARRGSGF